MNDMNTHDEHPETVGPVSTGFWRSRAGISLVVAFAVGGLMLGYEHRVHILGSDWLLWLPLLLCVGMHFFMHGGHGGHGGKHGGDGPT